MNPLKRFGYKVGKQSVVDSRTNKLQSLAALYSRDHSAQILEEMNE